MIKPTIFHKKSPCISFYYLLYYKKDGKNKSKKGGCDYGIRCIVINAGKAGVKELKDELENMHPVDIVEMLEDGLEYGKIDKRQMILLFRLLAKEEAAEVFTDMTSDTREVLINALTDSELEEVMEEMYVDDTVDVLEEMPANVVDRLLMATDEETRQKINALLNYPEDSAGSIMNIDYISLNKEMTVADAHFEDPSGWY